MRPTASTVLQAFGPDTFQAGLPNCVAVGAIASGASTDQVFAESNLTAVGLNAISLSLGKTKMFEISVFDTADELIVQENVRHAIADKDFFGIWSDQVIGRINVAGPRALAALGPTSSGQHPDVGASTG